MSYSFEFKAADKAAAKAKIATEFDRVVETQPDHAADRAAVVAAASAMIDLMKDSSESDIGVRVYGSLSWGEQPSAASITSTALGVATYFVPRTAA